MHQAGMHMACMHMAGMHMAGMHQACMHLSQAGRYVVQVEGDKQLRLKRTNVRVCA
jgi:hypothetical protein